MVVPVKVTSPISVAITAAGKEEEVLNVKKRFKEEKTALEHDKKKALAQANDAISKLEAADQRFYAYK